ncbi:MADS-box protein defh21-like [Lycium ferocissimum]|uniref:MADS-box protein defh21-like n=1 Tax=Lycium ferocissimum TaxID=112874 RepID=UPI0028166B41|nr:MADS-box protein defh21-like [Lycium ferocissimum]
MGRRKIGMELIKNERSRNLTYQKRKKGLEKKADELSTLCQVKLCMIIYAPKHGDKQQEEPVTIWPEKDTVRSLIESYRRRSDDDRRLRTHDLSFYFKDLARKVELESAKLRKSNHEAKYPTWDQLYDNLSTDQLKQLTALLGAKIEVTKQRLEFLKGTQTISLEDRHAMSFLGKQATHQPNTPCVMQSLVRKGSLQLEIIEQQQQPLVQPMNFPESTTHHAGPVTELVPFGHQMMMLNNNNNNNISSVIPLMGSGEGIVYTDVTSTLGGRKTVSDRPSAQRMFPMMLNNNNVENQQAMGMMRDQNMLLSNNIVDHHQYPHAQPVCYFVPVVTPTNYYQHQYQLLPNAAATATASYQMHASQREEYYEMADHFHLPNTTMK